MASCRREEASARSIGLESAVAANRPEGSSRANNKATAACAVLSVEMEREEMSALSVQVKGSKDWRVLALARWRGWATVGAEGRCGRVRRRVGSAVE